jgi:beta-lactamase regulating signal transducer with metallopeptidase domain
MDAIIQYFQNEWAYTLWNVSWQVGVLVGFIWIVSLFARNTSPGFQYWLWCIVLLRLCVPVELSLSDGVRDQFRLGLTTVTRIFEHSAEEPPLTAEHPTKRGGNSDSIPGDSFPFALSGFSVVSAPSAPVLGTVTPFIVTLFWGIAILLFAAYLGLRIRRIRLALASCSPVVDVNLLTLVKQCCYAVGLRKTVDVRLSDSPSILGPAVIGLLRPVVVLPGRMCTEWTTQELEPVLLHELAHIRRRDNFVNFVQIIVQVVYFFHPLVWYANRKIRIYREDACDATALELMGADRKRYVNNLLRVVEEMQGKRPALLGVGFAEHKSSLSRRVIHILHNKSNLHPHLTKGAAASLLLVVVSGAILTFACCSSGPAVQFTKTQSLNEITNALSAGDKFGLLYLESPDAAKHNRMMDSVFTEQRIVETVREHYQAFHIEDARAFLADKKADRMYLYLREQESSLIPFKWEWKIHHLCV